jgi:16S rRNA (adenine1518-N6/adenine1519-N6)-dimethyltransferase
MPASSRRRVFGQHFLRDETVISKIVSTTFDYVEKHSARSLLEIGPGKGAITHPLLGAAKSAVTLERILIVEKDRKLAAEWVDQTRDSKRVEILEADFLEVKSEAYLGRGPLIVVSNLPYSAGTAILQEVARFPAEIPAMVLMFQAEVAARLRAVPREKAWGSLGLWIQNRWDVKKLLAVPPKAFAPPPEVNSEVVVLEARKTLRVPCPPCPNPEFNEKWLSAWETNWEKLIRVPFLHRRKMLRSGLPKNSIWKDALDAAEIDGTRRAEELEWSDWEKWLAAVHTATFKFNHS